MLLKLEKAKERDEARKFAEQKRILNERRLKLSELEGYLGEYEGRFADLSRSGVEVAQLRASYAFIGQLSDAISQQRQAVLEGERCVEEYRQYWLEAKQRVDILQMTRDKMLVEELDKDGRIEQSLADEVARQKFNRS